MEKTKQPKQEPKSPSPAAPSPETTESEKPQSPVKKANVKTSPPPEEDFESYYIKGVTAEFADDIDKLRNAPDFSEYSVPVLIQALKQGSQGFGEDEKEIVMKGR